MKFTRTYSVRGSEINPDYTLKDYYLGMYFQECFAEYAASKGAAAYDVAKIGLTWITSDIRMEFFPPMPLWRDSIGVSVWIHKTGAARMFVNFKAECGNKTLAKGASIQLIADMETHKPQKLGRIAGLFEIDSEHVFEGEHFDKIGQFDNGCCADFGMTQTTQTVRYDDLDFNMHLNNVRYIPRALEAVPIEYRLSHSLMGYRIKFEREAKFGDEITSICTKRGNSFTHRLYNAKSGISLCGMQTDWKPIKYLQTAEKISD